MSTELNFAELSKHRRQSNGGGKSRHAQARSSRRADDERPIPEPNFEAPRPPRPSAHHDDDIRPLPFDPWRLVDALQRRSKLIFAGAALVALFGVMAGIVRATYSVKVHLIHREAASPFNDAALGEGFQRRDVSFDTLATLFKAPELLHRVSTNSRGKWTPGVLSAKVSILPTFNPDIITLAVKHKGDPSDAASLANLYAEEMVHFTEELQKREAREIRMLLEHKLTSIHTEIEALQERLVQFSRDANIMNVEKETGVYLDQLSAAELNYQNTLFELETLELKLSQARKRPGADKLQEAENELNRLLLDYKEAHPLVKRQRELIRTIEEQARVAANPANDGLAAGNTFGGEIAALEQQRNALTNQVRRLFQNQQALQTRLTGVSEKGVQFALLHSRVETLEKVRSTVADRHREAQLLEDNALGMYNVYSRAEAGGVPTGQRMAKIIVFGIGGALFGLMLTSGFVLASEVIDSRLKTAGDVERVTHLQVLASLGDLSKMKPNEQVDWAFRTLTLLKGKLNARNDESVVCGFMSANPQEGRSTWINLLVGAASQRGLPVLTVTTRPSTDGADDLPDSEDFAPTEALLHDEHAMLPSARVTTLSKNVLAHPARVAEQLADPRAQPIVHVPLPGWVWNLERRHQWQEALHYWRKIDNLVLLVELPPASRPESFLLAENVPQILWLTSSGMATAEETKTHLATLRHARCNLVGAVINRAPKSWRAGIGRWFTLLAFIPLLAGSAPRLSAAEPAEAAQPSTPSGLDEVPSARPGTFSVTARHRAPWQERLTLGPGDVVNLQLYGYPDLTRTNLIIGPDGRLSYLQAQGLPVAGLTIDELRARLTDELGQFYRSADAIVLPVTFNSKKYYVLGAVNTRGAYVLDRPVTIVEAVARAGGLQTGMLGNETVEMADLSRSFLARNGEKVEVSLEGLFLEGDLSQNAPLAPDDYLYFAPQRLTEVYVVGEVQSPGAVTFVPRLGLIPALSARGGFTPRAYKSKILVVRGSLHRPETFVVSAADILAARKPDFRLEERDIVYVSARPWIKVEELLDEAAQSFVQAMITTWTGVNIGPVITRPITPTL